MSNPVAVRDENVFLGVIGAFLFSLAGGVVWFVLDLVGFYAGLSGLVGVVCAIQGYRIFGGRLSKKGVIISAIIAMLVLVLAWYLCFCKDLYLAHKEWYESNQIDYLPTFAECAGIGWLYLFDNMDIGVKYLINLGIGIVLAIVGAARYTINAFRSEG